MNELNDNLTDTQINYLSDISFILSILVLIFN